MPTRRFYLHRATNRLIEGAIIAAFLAIGAADSLATPITVDSEVVIMIDISGSIDAIEMATQWQGWGDAIAELGAEGAFTSGPQGKVALGFGVFSTLPFGPPVYYLVDSPAVANTIRDDMLGLITTGLGATNVGGAIGVAAASFETNNYDSPVQIICVSGDGISNFGPDTLTMRNSALAAGVERINGLYIVGDPQNPIDQLKSFYETEVAGGEGAFVSGVATGHTELGLFKEAIKQHLGFTLNSNLYSPPPDAVFVVPEPSGVMSAFIGSAGLICWLWRRERRLPSNLEL
ncbi:MAG: DUF1194 domain-containing protein [Pirellulales bacterium]